jgi:hypothetical protein
MEAVNPSWREAVAGFLELVIDKFLKAIGYRKRIHRPTAPTDGFPRGIVDVDDTHLFHWCELRGVFVGMPVLK